MTTPDAWLDAVLSARGAAALPYRASSRGAVKRHLADLVQVREGGGGAGQGEGGEKRGRGGIAVGPDRRQCPRRRGRRPTRPRRLHTCTRTHTLFLLPNVQL